MGNTRPENEIVRLRTEVLALKAALIDADRRNEVWEGDRRHSIPVEEVHRALDGLNLPRRSPHGWSLFLGERFTLLKVWMERESQ